MTKVRYQLGWRNVFTVSCKFVSKKGGKGVSRSGGIALFWNENTCVALSSYSFNHIDVLVGESSDPKRWRFTGIYGHPKVGDRHLTWSLLKLLCHKSTLPWLLGGDFNEILCSHEKVGGLPRSSRQMDDFKEVVDFCAIKSLQAEGPKFTWSGNRCGHDVMVRLDRFFANSDWTDLFLASHASNLKPSKSDHLPILIEVREFSPKKKRKKRRFRFEEEWLQDDDCLRIVHLG
jgi:hypothetical protein